jgi:serine/threonine protein kinase
VFICPECRSVYTQRAELCERDRVPLVPVQANQDPRTYPLLNTELDGRYHLIGGLGQGGVGTVYLANHIHLDQLSAVKFLDVDMLGEVDEEQREESLQDFVKEAKLAMMLRHDYVVRVMDYGVHERCPFLVMEYVPGPSLLRRMNAGERFDVRQCVNVITRLAEALGAFHDRKLVHRDLKPANVILDPRDNGELTLVDLGLVKDLSNEARSSTHPLALRGTPGYLSPEQVPSWVLSSAGVEITSEKQPVDARVDVYALGVLAFELLSGQTPYPKGMSPTKVIVYTCTKPTPDLLSLCPHIEQTCPGLAKLVMSMMAKKPRNRPHDAAGVLEIISSLVFQDELQGSQHLSNEINKATQALVNHIKPTPLASLESPEGQNDRHRGRVKAKEARKPLTPSQAGSNQSAPISISGSLIPPPSSLRRSGGVDVSLLNMPSDESTVHLDGTIDEDAMAEDLSISDHLQEAKTEVSDRPYVASPIAHNRYNASPYIDHSQLDPQPKMSNNSHFFWVGVVLVSAVVGIFSALLNTSPTPNNQMRIVMGANLQANQDIKRRNRTKKPPRNRPIPKKKNVKQNTAFATPRISRPSTRSFNRTTDKMPSNKVDRSKQNAGVVEVDIDEDKLPSASRQNNRPKTAHKSSANQTSKLVRRSSRTATKKSSRKRSKPLTVSQYRLLKLQIENLLRNQRVAEARRKLSTVKSRLKPSDQFYLEINMLLDSISH